MNENKFVRVVKARILRALKSGRWASGSKRYGAYAAVDGKGPTYEREIVQSAIAKRARKGAIMRRAVTRGAMLAYAPGGAS